MKRRPDSRGILKIDDRRLNPVPVLPSPFFTDSALNNSEIAQGISASTAIVDLLVELFELKEKNNWLRRQAVVLFLQQLFGDTVGRRATDMLRWAVGTESATYILVNIRDTYWPQGVFNISRLVRTSDAKNKTKESARNKLLQLVKQFNNVIGKQNTLIGGKRFFNVFQNRRLNQHLLYTVLDELIMALFPEIKKQFKP